MKSTVQTGKPCAALTLAIGMLIASSGCLAWEPEFGRPGMWEITQENVTGSLDGVPEPPLKFSAKECVGNLLETRTANFFTGKNDRSCQYTDVSGNGKLGSWRFNCKFDDRTWHGTVRHSYDSAHETVTQRVSITIESPITPKIITGEKVVSARWLSSCKPVP